MDFLGEARTPLHTPGVKQYATDQASRIPFCSSCSSPMSSLSPTSLRGLSFDENITTSDMSNAWFVHNSRSFPIQQDTPEISTDQTLTCPLCQREFSGSYGYGNLRRHTRSIHGGTDSSPITFPCGATGCTRAFKRQDARLKHERRHHPQLQRAPPVDRKVDFKENSINSISTQEHHTLLPNKDNGKLTHGSYAFDLVSMKDELWPNTVRASLLTGLQLPRGLYSKFNSSTQTATDLPEDDFFALLHYLLQSQPDLIKRFIRHWEVILVVLQERSADPHMVAAFSQILRYLETAMDSQACETCTFQKDGNCQSQCGVRIVYLSIISSPQSLADSHRQAPLGPEHQARQPATRRGRMPTHMSSSPVSQGSDESLTTSSPPVLGLKDATRNSPSRSYDCPIFKHNRTHGLLIECKGTHALHMANFRHHLEPDRSQTHRDFPGFIQLCQRCNEHVISKEEWPLHQQMHCTSPSRHQGDGAAQRIRLYRKLFPGSRCIPSPYVGDDSCDMLAMPNNTLHDSPTAIPPVSELSWSSFIPNLDADARYEPSQQRSVSSKRESETQMLALNQQLECRAALRTVLLSTLGQIQELMLEASTTFSYEARRQLADEIEPAWRRHLEYLRGSSPRRRTRTLASLATNADPENSSDGFVLMENRSNPIQPYSNEQPQPNTRSPVGLDLPTIAVHPSSDFTPANPGNASGSSPNLSSFPTRSSSAGVHSGSFGTSPTNFGSSLSTAAANMAPQYVVGPDLSPFATAYSPSGIATDDVGYPADWDPLLPEQGDFDDSFGFGNHGLD